MEVLNIAFVEEKISDEDLKSVNWTGFTDYEGQMNIPPSYWIIDRARNFFFWSIWKKMPGSPREKFGLWLAGEIVYVHAFKTYSEIFVEGRGLCEVCCWNEIIIVNSQDSRYSKSDLKNIVREAFEVYGNGAKRPGSPVAITNFQTHKMMADGKAVQLEPGCPVR